MNIGEEWEVVDTAVWVAVTLHVAGAAGRCAFVVGGEVRGGGNSASWRGVAGFLMVSELLALMT